MLQKELIEQTASHWDQMASSSNDGLILHWWESPMLHGLVDAYWSKTTGCANAGEYIRRKTGRSSLGTGISIGCGAAEDEISLLEQGVLERLIICDISNEQLNKAEDFASYRGIKTDRLIRLNEVDFDKPFPQKLDLIYWRHSLHHMFDTHGALEWCRDSLTVDGAVYCNDVCAPNYMQWDDKVLDWVELYRASLPNDYLKSPFRPDEYMPCRPSIPSVEHWRSIDPSECVDSANIIPSISKLAPLAEITFLGGCIYGLALDDIINNFRRDSDLNILENSMTLDKFMSDSGMNHFFTCVLNRKDFI